MTTTRPIIAPVCIASDRLSVERNGEQSAFSRRKKAEAAIAVSRRGGFTKGYCIPCNRPVSFQLAHGAGQRSDRRRLPINWREGLICPRCKMSNRQRLMAALVMQHLTGKAGQRIYLMEQMTSLYRYFAEHLPEQTVIGSEYFGARFCGGRTIKAWQRRTSPRNSNLLRWLGHEMKATYAIFRMGGIRHEDVTRLQFKSGSLDLVVSNDVFEHVPDPYRAFAECARVIRPGGQMLATIPFYNGRDRSVTRARIGGHGPIHLLPPVYHGNPVCASGSLVFTDFGWDVIHLFQRAGFSRVSLEVYASAKFGHLGSGLLVFRLTR